MKKLLLIVSLLSVLCALFALNAFATTGATSTACQGCEVCNPSEGVSMDDMPEMKFEVDGEAFLDSLGYMGKGMLGIFVVTLVIVGVVAILNWHGRSLERRNKNKEDK